MTPPSAVRSRVRYYPFAGESAVAATSAFRTASVLREWLVRQGIFHLLVRDADPMAAPEIWVIWGDGTAMIAREELT